jgi:hypothetical protein
MKVAALLSLLARSPAEFFERSAMIVRARWDTFAGRRFPYASVSFENGLRQLEIEMGWQTERFLREGQLAEIEAVIRQRQASLPSGAPFGQFHNGDASLGRLCYLAARALRPKSIVETGVCYGVTSSYLLQALKDNREGHLRSIDLPPLGKNGDDYVGWLVPRDLCGRWSLRRGTSPKLLGPLLKELGAIDLFVHDSLHTYGNMKVEFNLAWPVLRPGGVLIADDIEGNAAFHELSLRTDVA